LATGGLGQIFLRTTNPAGARGDGVAMAYRAGASVADMEFVQFHPTAFYQPEAPPFLISEAVRGAGARLVNGNGQPFMQKYDPEWRDLAPRDVVARCIHQEMMVTGAPNVYLDLRSYIPADQIAGRFPNIYAQCLAYGVDITRELAPVVPAAHYACGGVWVDDWGRTTVDQLYAVGEVARTGLHGANRLASTSLLEGLVWGYRAAQDIEGRLAGQRRPNPAGFRPAGCTGPAAAKADIERMMAAIRQIMWYNVGLERTTHSLEEAREKLGSLGAEIERFYQNHRLSDALVGLRNAGQAARLVTQAALDNREGVGCHYRIEECVPN
jgi:L-aspartate oxidase